MCRQFPWCFAALPKRTESPQTRLFLASGANSSAPGAMAQGKLDYKDRLLTSLFNFLAFTDLSGEVTGLENVISVNRVCPICVQNSLFTPNFKPSEAFSGEVPSPHQYFIKSKPQQFVFILYSGNACKLATCPVWTLICGSAVRKRQW